MNCRGNSKVYKVNSLMKNDDCEANYFLPNIIWEQAELLTDFSQPWSNQLSKKTEFKALYNEYFLFLRYEIEDENVLIYDQNKSKLDVANSDRVEIFFRKDKNMNPYFCLEIDPKGKVLDYKAELYRRFDNSWNWPSGHLFTKGIYIKNGYRVDITLSLESLKKLGLLENNTLEAGIYRGDCTKLPENLKDEAKIEWITWADPKTDEPDFHVSTSFGKIILNE